MAESVLLSTCAVGPTGGCRVAAGRLLDAGDDGHAARGDYGNQDGRCGQ